MDYPCYRCHADIPEGVAFCPHCGAPQIRVVAPDSEAEAQPETSSPVPGTPAPQWPMASNAYPPQPGAIHWHLAWKGALLSGLGAAALTALPFIQIGFLLWMLGAGALSVSLYRKQLGGPILTAGMGMKVGALAGVFGFVANSVVTALSFVLRRNSIDLRGAMEQQMHKQMAGNSDPQAQQMMQNMLDWMTSPQGEATMIVLVLVIVGVFFVLLTAAGGALAASMSGQRREFR